MAQSFQSRTSEEPLTEEMLFERVTMESPSRCTGHGHHLNK